MLLIRAGQENQSEIYSSLKGAKVLQRVASLVSLKFCAVLLSKQENYYHREHNRTIDDSLSVDLL